MGLAEVFKWVDEKGNVHFADSPPASSPSEKVDIAPARTHQSAEEARERFERLQEYQQQLRESRKDETRLGAKPVISSPPDVKCFTSLADAWAGKVSDTREAVQRSALSKSELRQMESMFQALEGHWHGEMVDINCLRPEAKPPTESDHYNFRLKAQWEADQLFEIGADLEPQEKEGSLRRQFFWILLSLDGLRFRKSTEDLSFELDKPRYDVEIMKSGKNAITFFVRRGGTQRRMNVFSFHKAGKSFTIREFFFVQGVLAGKRLWSTER
jgi:hypothetical protein